MYNCPLLFILAFKHLPDYMHCNSTFATSTGGTYDISEKMWHHRRKQTRAMTTYTNPASTRLLPTSVTATACLHIATFTRGEMWQHGHSWQHSSLRVDCECVWMVSQCGAKSESHNMTLLVPHNHQWTTLKTLQFVDIYPNSQADTSSVYLQPKYFLPIPIYYNEIKKYRDSITWWERGLLQTTVKVTSQNTKSTKTNTGTK